MPTYRLSRHYRARFLSGVLLAVACSGGPGCSQDSVASDLLISEIMQNPRAVSDAVGEYLELYNPSASAIDIEGWTLRDEGSDSHVIRAGQPLLVPAQGFLVLGIQADRALNGGVPVAYQYSGLALANGADEVVLVDTEGTIRARVAYDGGPVFPDPNGASMSLDPARSTPGESALGTSFCASVSVFGAGDRGTPGAPNDRCPGSPPCGPAGPCGVAEGPAVEQFIHQVQGSGPSVAFRGRVEVAGIATARFERGDALDGFFLQEEDADADGDTATSEGIFVFCRGACPSGLAVGDAVRVRGDTAEFFGMSQVDATVAGSSIEILASRQPLPRPVAVALPASGSTRAAATFEALEGMLVQLPGRLVVSETFQLARYGQLMLSRAQRPHQFTHTESPSVSGYRQFSQNLERNRIVLDDLDNDQNDPIVGARDEPYFFPPGGLSVSQRLRGGDSVEGLVGVLHWSFAGQPGTEAWRLRPVPERFEYPFVPENPRPALPPPVSGRLRAASFNVLNYFTTVDQGGARCGPSQLECRGADSVSELARQRSKLVAALRALDADVVGVVEVENDSGRALADLATAASSPQSGSSYRAIATGALGSDAIRVGLLYRPARLAPLGEFAVLDSSVDARFVDTKNRPVLVQTFEERATGERFTVAVGHLKSKGSDCNDLGDPNLGDGQGNCNRTRLRAAQALAAYLATDPTGSGDPDVLLLGDLNAYRKEDPVAALLAAGYSDLLGTRLGDRAYSFVFDGQLGYLDHALASPSLAEQVSGATVWHINADEVPLFDYNDGVRDGSEATFERKSAALPLFAPDPYRSSDHDPIVVGLELGRRRPAAVKSGP